MQYIKSQKKGKYLIECFYLWNENDQFEWRCSRMIILRESSPRPQTTKLSEMNKMLETLEGIDFSKYS